jgi:hypothetical protein
MNRVSTRRWQDQKCMSWMLYSRSTQQVAEPPGKIKSTVVMPDFEPSVLVTRTSLIGMSLISDTRPAQACSWPGSAKAGPQARIKLTVRGHTVIHCFVITSPPVETITLRRPTLFIIGLTYFWFFRSRWLFLSSDRSLNLMDLVCRKAPGFSDGSAQVLDTRVFRKI